MSIPIVPEDCQGQFTDTELGEIWHQIMVELLDDNFISRTHGNRRTYDAGCQGPLCRKAVREHGRRRTKTAPSEKYKYLDPILDAWSQVALDRIISVRQAMLEQIAPAS